MPLALAAMKHGDAVHHVGRVIVGEPEPHGWMVATGADGDLPEEALKAFPTGKSWRMEGSGVLSALDSWGGDGK